MRAKKALLGEFAGTAVVVAVSEVADKKSAPAPSAFMSAFIVFFVLSLASDFGPGSARVAVYLGGLIFVLVVIKHSAGILKGFEVLQGKGQ